MSKGKGRGTRIPRRTGKANAHRTCVSPVANGSSLADEHFAKGNAMRREGRIDKAMEHYRQALNHSPSSPAILTNLGTLCRQEKRLGEARDYLEKALALDSNMIPARNSLALVYEDLGDLERASRHFAHAVEANASIPELHRNAGRVFFKMHHYDKAIASFKTALSFNPGDAESLQGLGLVFGEQREFYSSRDAFLSALRVSPDHPEIWFGLGCLFREWNYADEARRCFLKAASLKQENVRALCNLGELCQIQGEIDEADALYRQCLEIAPNEPLVSGNFIYLMNFSSRFTRQEVFDAHKSWGDRFGISPNILPPPDRRSHTGRLRIGYLSPDFRNHPVSSFFEPLLRERTREEFEVFCYANVRIADDMTDHLREQADCWRDISVLNDRDGAALVRSDEIDILVDLAGHCRGNRLGLMSLRPAPVQFSYLGYPNTTGMPAIDYMITDPVADPPGAEQYFTERLLRLDRCFACYSPRANAPEPSASPFSENGHITFGSTHTLARLNNQVLDLWARVLHTVPDSRLLIARNSMSEAFIERASRRFESAGIQAERITFQKQLPKTGHLHLYDKIDITLDTFPWSGHTTACESLWMGVPIVTIMGDRHAGRMVASTLVAAGFPDFIAESPDHYLEIIRVLANDKEKLRHLRANLRTSLRTSPLCDAKRFTHQVEQVFRNVWRDHCDDAS